MTGTTDPLVLDLVEWIAHEPVAGIGVRVAITAGGEKLLRDNRRGS